MGVCDSSPKNFASMSTQDESASNKQKNKLKEKITYLKNNNGYILPQNLAKRDNVHKYYNMKQKVLGEGASGIVCIGEKDGVQYAIKKIKKDKIKSIKPFLLEAITKFMRIPNLLVM